MSTKSIAKPALIRSVIVEGISPIICLGSGPTPINLILGRGCCVQPFGNAISIILNIVHRFPNCRMIIYNQYAVWSICFLHRLLVIIMGYYAKIRLGAGRKIIKRKTTKEIVEDVNELKTDALFFEAKDKKALSSIYDEIDRLEKTEIELKVNALFKDLFQWSLGFAVFTLLLEIGLSRTLLMKIP